MDQFQYSCWHWLLLFTLACLPLSCTAQKNTLTLISSSKRSDNKGYVVRFHLNRKVNSFNYSQPRAYLIQLQLRGKNITTQDIDLHDLSRIIKDVKYYSIEGGIGVDLLLNKQDFYRAGVYPDRTGNDLLVGLSRTSYGKLMDHIKKMKAFAWSDTPLESVAALNRSGQEAKTAVDTAYQIVKNKTRFDTIVLDPGHGGHDTGAIGYHHALEKNVVLAIAKKVGHYINKYMPSVKVVYTRNSDTFVDLKERGRIANRANGDLFVCIHANSARARQAHGTETYFLGLERSKTALQVMERENNVVTTAKADPDKKISRQQLMIYKLANSGYIKNSEKLASMIQRQFKNRAGRKSRGVKQARFVVLYHASMPAILVETGFITNPREQKFMTSSYGQSIIASAIFRAIRNYGNQMRATQHLEPVQQ